MIVCRALVFLVILTVTRAWETCCSDIGCFNDDAPFNNKPLPTCPFWCNLIYKMYTRLNRDSGQSFSHDTAVPAVYDGRRRTVFIVHGWQNDGLTATWLHTMKNAFLAREDMNVVIVDWGLCAHNVNYIQSASDTRTVGAYTALVYQNLLRVAGSNPSRMWCTGHSLGSHVCGHAGMRMPAGSELGRVTGMDPAGPCFEKEGDVKVGLNPTSAKFVDVIHTDTTYGALRNLGHIDFYPNGGTDQPGCLMAQNNATAESQENKDTCFIPSTFGICSHLRAYEFFTQSILLDCFLARYECTDYEKLPGSCQACSEDPCAIMGYSADKSARQSGMYYLNASKNEPYCMN